MKKLLFLSVMLMGVVTANAQLKVNSNGNIGINANTYSSRKVYINYDGEYSLYVRNSESEGKAIFAYNTCSADSSSTYGVSTYTTSSGNHNSVVGVYGHTVCSNANMSVGVYGLANNRLQGNVTYGVMGKFRSTNTCNGAAIYGVIGNISTVMDKKYAGFFKGPVKVDGNLDVTGTVNGIVLSPSASATPSNTISQGDETNRMELSSRLDGLTTNTYYINMPESKATALQSVVSRDAVTERSAQSMTNVDEEEEHEDEICEEGCKEELSKLEAQVYSKKHYGLSVEQLETTFPDLVYENEDGSKSINYMEMVPILVQAINELSAKVEELEGGGSSRKAKMATGLASADENVTLLSLGQNKPNPFGKTTSIAVCVPENVKTAFLYVYNLNGNKVAQVDITARGASSVTLSASNLSDGMYLYSLIADGKVVETKRMIVEK